MLRGFTIMILANLFNLSDLITTLYAIHVLGFSETNVIVRKLLESNPILYASFKIFSVLALSLVYIMTSRSKNPFVIGVNRGCVISFCMMIVVLGLATILNIWQIAFDTDVTPILALIAKMIPTLHLR